jgi:tetratricopeptide (TPR) repeat protein
MLFRPHVVLLIIFGQLVQLITVAAEPAAPFLAEPQPPLAAAIALFDAKRIPEARAQFAAITTSEPKNAVALWYLGKCELKLQHAETAADTLTRAATLAPQDPRIQADCGSASLQYATKLGLSFSAIGYARRGRDALEQAVKLDPESIDYREGLVQFYTRAPAFVGGDFARAYLHIAEIAKRDPARGTVVKANALCSEKRYDEARVACEDFLLAHPDNYLALYTLGRIASETGHDLERGEQALRRCLELTPRIQEPDHAGARYRLGMIAEKTQRTADARREYQAALVLEPTLDKAATALARLPQ